MEQATEQIITGKLKTPFVVSGVDMESGKRTSLEIKEWNMRAMWSYLRLLHGHSPADGLIHKDGLDEAFTKHWNSGKYDRKIQFIFDGNKLIAAASTKHLLIPPRHVYHLAQKLMHEKFGDKIEAAQLPDLLGAVYYLEETAGFKVGLQIYGGDIITRTAITVCNTIRVHTCFNPLSWLGGGELAKFGGGISGDFERVLRVKKITELEPRLKQAIEAVKPSRIQDRIQVSQGIKLDMRQARIITAAFGLSYSLGVKTLEQVISRFMDEGARSCWHLSMAASWVANHGKLRATPEGYGGKARQSLSTIAGAAILIDDVKTVEEKSVEWLRAHVKNGELKTVEQLLQGVEL